MATVLVFVVAVPPHRPRRRDRAGPHLCGAAGGGLCQRQDTEHPHHAGSRVPAVLPRHAHGRWTSLTCLGAKEAPIGSETGGPTYLGCLLW